MVPIFDPPNYEASRALESSRVRAPTVCEKTSRQSVRHDLDAELNEKLSRSPLPGANEPLGRGVFVNEGTSLPEFMNLKPFGKMILAVHVKFGLFLGHPLSQ